MKSTLTLVYANICITCIRLWFYLTLPKVVGVCAREVYLQNYQCTYNYDDNDWLECAFALLRVVNWWSTDGATNTTIYALNQTQYGRRLLQYYMFYTYNTGAYCAWLWYTICFEFNCHRSLGANKHANLYRQ